MPFLGSQKMFSETCIDDAAVQAHFKPLHLTACVLHHLLTPHIYLIIMIILPENGLIQMCMLCFVFVYVLWMIDRWRCEGQSVVGVGPHSHSFWEETDEEVGEPAPHRLGVSTGPSEAPPHSASVSVLVIQFHSATQYMWTPGGSLFYEGTYVQNHDQGLLLN